MQKTFSLKENYEFLRLYKKGKFFVGKYIILYVSPNRTKTNRIGISINRKFGKSVKRNRVRRLIKESYRFYEPFIKEWYDFVFVARKNETLPSFIEIKKEMKFLLKKLGVFDQDKWELLKKS